MTLSRNVELKLYAYRKNRDGLIVSFIVHPNDEAMLTGVDIGDVFNAILTPSDHDIPARATSLDGRSSIQPSRNRRSNGELTEGERLRTRAVMLCKDERFQNWAHGRSGKEFPPTEDGARSMILYECEIDSRSELALSIPGQAKFRMLLDCFAADTGQTAERRGG
jgi:hypothetical protein